MLALFTSVIRKKIIVFVAVIVLIPSLAFHSPDAISSQDTYNNIRRGALGGLILFGVINAYWTGLNIPNVSGDINFDECKPNTNQTDEEIRENCLIKPFNRVDNIGYLAMLGTLAPSVDAPLALANVLFLTAAGVRHAVTVPKETTGGHAGAAVGTILLISRIVVGGYMGYYYGEGDQEAAGTVEKNSINTAAFNNWCNANLAKCTEKAETVYLRKDASENWWNATEPNTGTTYEGLNRFGGATVGFIIGYLMADAVLFPVEFGLYNLNGHLGLEFSLNSLRSLAVLPSSNGEIIYTVLAKAFIGLSIVKSVASLAIYFSPGNPFEGAAPPLWNGKQFNAASLAAINGIDLADLKEIDLASINAHKNTKITLNLNGVIYHKSDPDGTKYNSLANVTQSIDYILGHSDLKDWNSTQIKEIDTTRNSVGVALYSKQFRMLTVATFNNLLSIPANGKLFVEAFKANKCYFAGDMIWNAINIAVFIPYSINLMTAIGQYGLTGASSIDALLARLADNQTLSEGELLAEQYRVVGLNLGLIGMAWVGNIFPRFTSITQMFVNPYVDSGLIEFQQVKYEASNPISQPPETFEMMEYNLPSSSLDGQ